MLAVFSSCKDHTTMQVLYIMFQGIKADLKQFSFLCTLIEHRNGIKCLKLKWNHELQVGGNHS